MTSQPTIAIIAPGEMGSGVGRRLAERGARVLSIPAAGFRVGAWASSAAEGTSSSSAPLPPRQFVAYCAWSAGGGDASLYLAPKRRALAVCYGAVKVMIEEWSR